MKKIGIIGGGPAGLMAAEVVSGAGHRVSVFEAMPTVGRKLLMAGKSGLNLTHAEPHESFVTRFGDAADRLRPMLDDFTGEDVREWAAGLGQETFTGSSGRVFPVSMKASPLLRAWLARLEAQGVSVLTRHRWVGFVGIAAPSSAPSGHLLPRGEKGGSVQAQPIDGASSTGKPGFPEAAPRAPLSPRGRGAGGEGAVADANESISLQFETPEGLRTQRFDAVILALGGASWPRLGSDAAWVSWLEKKGIKVRAFRPANCGFDVAWSGFVAERFSGAPVKSVAATSGAGTVQGEFVITRSGIEGSLVYAHSAALRDALEAEGGAVLTLDLLPGREAERIRRDLERAGRKASFANRLRKAGLDAVKAALVREFSTEAERADAAALSRCIKALPLAVTRARPIAEAISSAGGVAWEAVDENLMLSAVPGIFVAGEMLDWEAPTGGYLLTACLATGRWAGRGALNWLDQSSARPSDSRSRS